MIEYRKQIRDVVRAVEITSPTSFAWLGSPSERLPTQIRRAIPDEVARAHLLATLRERLYKDYYRIGFASASLSEVGEVSVSCQETKLAAKVAEANVGKGYLEDGWVVQSVEGERIAVRRRGLELWVTPEGCSLSTGAALTPGANVRLQLPRESFDLSPGYYTAMSDTPLAWEGIGTLVRLYWNVRPEYAARLVRAVTWRLNSQGVPFRLKVLNDAIFYGRCDTAVMYLLKPDVGIAGRSIAQVYEEVREGCRPPVPALTKKLAPGVALAEEVGQGESFGQHRCGVLAEGLVRAHDRGLADEEQRLGAVTEVLEEAGISMQRPYLAAGSADDYDLRLDPQPRRSLDGRGRGSASFLAVASEIGRRLAQDAVWHEDCCNWLGLLPQEYGPRQLGLSYGALGHDLYDGTSGIALFLAQLYGVTREDALRRTALGAVRQALAVTEVPRHAQGIGLYTGSIGVALAAASAGIILAEDSLLERSQRLVADIATGSEPPPEDFDLLSGRAGAVVGLAVLYEMRGHDLYLDVAIRLGNELVQSADRSRLGWSWKADTRLKHPNLTGLSHGSAGAGHALLELYRLTGEATYAEGAVEAFRYERAWYSDAARNWPDFREDGGRRRSDATVHRTQWCHGAAGIALSRLRAYEVLGDERYREEACVALATTERDTAEAQRHGSLSFCLCHGLGGNADILLEGRACAGDGGSLPELIGASGADECGEGRLPWPCGIPVPGSETPGLMLGLSGIGYFYLRLAFPRQIPSLLLLRPQSFSDRLQALAGAQRMAVATDLRDQPEVEGEAPRALRADGVVTP